LLGYIFTYFNDLRISKRTAELERINRQLGELYGPLYALADSSTITFAEFLKRYRPGQPSFFNTPPNEDELKIWRLWMSDVFMPTNLKMYDIILNKADLLIEEEMPKCLLDLGAHVAAYKAIMKKWEKHDFSEHQSLLKFPRKELREYVEKSYKELKSKQKRLIESENKFFWKI
jgi:hypothetical protein